MRVFFVLIVMLGLVASNAEAASQFEQKDIVGTTENINETVGTVVFTVAPASGKPIAEALIRCPARQPGGRKECLVSFTSSSGPFLTLQEGEFIGWSLKGYMTQFWIVGTSANTDFEI